MADIEVKLRLTADGTVLVNTTSQAEGAVGQLGSATVKAGQQASQGFDIAARGSANLKAEMTEARNTAVELAAAFGGLTAIKGLAGMFIEAADAQGQLDARMRRVTESQAEQAAATARLQQIAHDAYEDINRLTEVFVRSMEVTRQFGISTAQTLDITEALALSMVVSASAADKRQQSIDALSKSMQNGYIATEQLEGILAGAPRFVTALEQALGKTRAELIGMARDGELTIDMVTRVSSELEILRAEVEDMPTTVEDAALRWGNAFQAWASSTNEVYGATALVVSSIDTLSANIDTVMLVAIMAATAGLGILLTQGARWVTGLYEQAQAAGVQAKATLEARQASLLLQQQQQAAAINFQRAAQADMARAEAALAVARADQAAARAAGLRATSEIAMARASIALTQADAAVAAAAGSVGAARAALVRANVAVVQSNAAVAASTREVDLAATGANGKLLSMSNVIAAITAGGLGWELGTWARQFEAVRVAADYSVALVVALFETLKLTGIATAEAFKAAWLGTFNVIREALVDLLGMSASVYERMARIPALDALGVDDLAAKLRQLQAQVTPTTSAWDGLVASVKGAGGEFKAALANALDFALNMEAGRQASEASEAAIAEFGRTGVVSTVAVDAALSKLGGSLRQQDAQLKEQVATYGKGRVGALEYAQSLELLKSATIADEAARARYEAGVRALFAPLIANAAALDALGESHKKNKQQIEAQQKAAADYIKGLQEQLATLGLSSAALVEHDIATRKLTDGQAAEARSIHAQIAARKAWLALEEKSKAASQSLSEKIAAQREQTLQQRDALAGLSQAQIAYNAAMREVDAMRQNAVGPLPEFDIAQVDALGEAITEAFTIDQALADFSDLQDIIQRVADTNMGGLARDILQIEEALKRGTDAAGNAFSTEQIERMSSALATMRKEQLHANIDAYIALGQAVVGGMKDAAEQGTRHYAALEVAQSALALAQGINAILNQGQGDPYSAFGRMAAMAATVIPLAAQLGASISNFAGSGFSDTAGQRQQAQGTGTVLGDAAAESQSIARGVEITADATSELVGINRGMLSALLALQAGVGSASGMLARGGNSLEFSALPDTRFSMAETLFGSTIGGVLDSVFGGLFGSISDKLLGGKSKITDQGIVILGGALSQMIENISVGAYQEVQYKTWAFGSTKTREEVRALGDDIGVQFQLVLDSMADAVREGARALGLNMDEVNAAIDAYRIAEIRISTQGLSAEEAQAELEAVFSSIFDGLAGSVIPFLPQFQRVGEGLGETLARVATGVQVTQEAIKQLGFALDETDPEKFAQTSEGLITLLGGIDEFISGMSSFVNAFATDEHKFTVAQEALNSAFAQAGLEVPATRDAMWDLMQTLDATTESGREQIATLLRLADVADDYYGMLEDRQEELASKLAEYADFIGQFRPDQTLPTGADATTIAQAQAQADAWAQAMIEQATALAEAAGLAGVAEADLALIHARAADAVAEASARIALAGIALDDWSADLRASTGELTTYAKAMRDAERWRDDAIAEATRLAQAAGLASARVEDLASIELRHAQLAAEALRQLRQSAQDLIAQLYGPAEGSLDAINARIAEMEANSSSAVDGLDDVSSGIENAVQAWLSGLQRVQDFLNALLLDQSLTTLTPQEQLAEAQAQFNAALAAAQGGDADALASLPDIARTLLEIGRGFWSSGDQYTELFNTTTAALQNLPAMAYQTSGTGGGGSTVTVAASAELQALYEERDRLLAEQEAANRLAMAQQLAGYLVELAAAQQQPILELAQTLGVRLDQFVTDLGVDLSHVSVATVQQLADLSGLLGVSLSDLAAGVGVSIGALTDQYSLAAGALAAEILGLPAEQAAALQPYFDAIAAATTAADASAATQTMADYISTLDAAIRDQLAPYFGSMMSEAESAADKALALAQSQYDTGVAQLEATAIGNALLTRIADNGFAANTAASIPAYAAGGWVNGPTALLAGEAGRELILPNPVSEFFTRVGIPINTSGSPDLLAEVRALREELRQLRAERIQGDGLVADAARGAGEKVSDKLDRQAAANDRYSRELIAALPRGDR